MTPPNKLLRVYVKVKLVMLYRLHKAIEVNLIEMNVIQTYAI